jgi:hypothetical protein
MAAAGAATAPSGRRLSRGRDGHQITLTIVNLFLLLPVAEFNASRGADWLSGRVVPMNRRRRSFSSSSLVRAPPAPREELFTMSIMYFSCSHEPPRSRG